MVQVNLLSPGMRVKIVDQWSYGCGQNSDGRMDKYLGQMVTVLEVDKRRRIAYIEEDAGDCPCHANGHWSWNSFCFDYIVEEEPQEDFQPASNGEIFSLIFGN